MPDAITINPPRKGEYLPEPPDVPVEQWTPQELAKHLEPGPSPAEGTSSYMLQRGVEALPYLAGTGAATLAGALSSGAGAAVGWDVPGWLTLLGRTSAAGLGQGGGEFARQEIYKKQGSPEAPRTAAEERERIASQMRWGAGTELVGGAIGLGLGKAFSPERIYASRLPHPGITQQADWLPVVRSAIKYRIPRTMEGAEKAVKLADNFNQQIDNIIAAKPMSSRAYVQDLKVRMDKLRGTYGQTGTHAVENNALIDKTERDALVQIGQIQPVRNAKGGMLQPRELKGPNDTLMTIPQLRQRAKFVSGQRMQQIKKNQWMQIRAQKNPKGNAPIAGFATGTTPGLDLLLDEEVGRTMREGLGNMYGQTIHDLNQVEGHMFEIDRALNRQELNEQGRRLFPYFAPVLAEEGFRGAEALTRMMGGGEPLQLLAGMATAGLPLYRGVMESPWAKSQLAFMGSRIPSAVAGEIVPGAARATQYYFETPQPPGGTEEVDPSEVTPLQPRAAGPQPATQATLGLPPRVPEPVAPPAAPVPPVYQDPGIPAPQRAILARQQQLVNNPLEGWHDDWQRMMVNASVKRNVPLGLLQSIAEQEGSYNYAQSHNIQDPNKVISSGNARGLMQVVPSTGKQYGGYSAEDLADPDKNIDSAAQYLNFLNTQYPNRPELVLAAYNIGPEALRKLGNDVTKLDDGAKRYVYRGLATWARLSADPKEAEAYIQTLPQQYLWK